MEEAFIAKLVSDTALVAVVETRIDWDVRPQHVTDLPAITLTMVSGNPDYSHDGVTGLVMSRIQVDCWGLTKAAALAASRAVKALLKTGFIQNEVTFQGCFLDNERQGYEEPGSEAPERFYRVSLDYLIWHG